MRVRVCVCACVGLRCYVWNWVGTYRIYYFKSQENNHERRTWTPLMTSAPPFNDSPQTITVRLFFLMVHAQFTRMVHAQFLASLPSLPLHLPPASSPPSPPGYVPEYKKGTERESSLATEPAASVQTPFTLMTRSAWQQSNNNTEGKLFRHFSFSTVYNTVFMLSAFNVLMPVFCLLGCIFNERRFQRNAAYARKETRLRQVLRQVFTKSSLVITAC